jgi:hypothetical protein
LARFRFSSDSPLLSSPLLSSPLLSSPLLSSPLLSSPLLFLLYINPSLYYRSQHLLARDHIPSDWMTNGW